MTGSRPTQAIEPVLSMASARRSAKADEEPVADAVGMAERSRGSGWVVWCGMEPPPLALDLKKDKGLTVQWADGTTSYFSVALLRKMSPSAEQRELRAEQSRNPLTVLPASAFGGGKSGPLEAEGAELVGNYAVRLRFSDGHSSGIYTWEYLRRLASQAP